MKKVLFLELGKKQTLAKYIKGSIYSINTHGVEPYDSLLKDWEKKSTDDLSVCHTGEFMYKVKVAGERNMVKSIFGSEANKFEIASKITIKRTSLSAGNWDEDYISFFSKQIEHFKETTASILSLE